MVGIKNRIFSRFLRVALLSIFLPVALHAQSEGDSTVVFSLENANTISMSSIQSRIETTPGSEEDAQVVIAEDAQPEKLNVRELVFDHIADSYGWHITNWGKKEITIPLPVIVKGEGSGWHLFSSSKLEHGGSYRGFSVATEGKYSGKVVESKSDGEVVRPWDFSVTKNVLSIFISSVLLIWLVLSTARWYKSRSDRVPKGMHGVMEMLVDSLQEGLVKPCIGKGYERYTPFLLTAFCFILLNNVMGIIPLFPGGANVTGNIAVTLILALFTFVIVNTSGTKAYWKEIFWPDVPVWLKVPIPLMPAIELFGVFTKPLALTIRLFANIMAGHAIILGLTCLIFITVSMGPVMNTSMTVVSIFFSVFMLFVELLVAFVQAYVFTMLSAVFIGLARVEHHKN